ncbi:MAG: hypothetical protein CO098_10515, partial [Bacteroidetes bacterium CG_4_9_14_3_um_filter_41_19]
FAESVPDGAWLNKHLNLQGITFEVNWNNVYPKNGLKHSFEIVQTHHTESEMFAMFEDYDDWLNVHPDYCPAYYPTDPNGCTTNHVEINDEYLEHSAVINQLNQRYGIINHFEHSGPLGLGLCAVTNSTQGLRPYDFQNLNTTNKYGIFVSGGCETVPIANDYYISEQWINAPNGGVAFVGSSVDYEAKASYSFNENFFNSIYTSNIYNIGNTKNYAALNSYNTDYQYKVVNLLGDPELSVYNDVPVNLSVTHLAGIETGTTDFNVTVNGYPTGEIIKICLFKEEEVYAFAESQTGNESFNITPDTPGEMKLTITCHNAEPYEAIINVSQSTDPHLYISNTTIIDENGNGFMEPGETVDLSIELSNSGANNATSISGLLSSPDANTTILQDYSAFPDIPAVQTGNSTVNYTFTTNAEDGFNGKAIPFEFEISSLEGNFSDGFFFNIKSAELENVDRDVLVNGSKSNTFNPGDIVEAFIKLENFGVVSANDLSGTLSTELNNDIAIINTGTQPYNDIDVFESETNAQAFEFEVGPNYSGEELLFKLTVTDEFGKTNEFVIKLLRTNT